MNILLIGGCADGEYHEVMLDASGRPQPEIRIHNKQGWSPHAALNTKESVYTYHSYRAEELREGSKSIWIYVCGIQPGNLLAELIAGYTPAISRRPKITR